MIVAILFAMSFEEHRFVDRLHDMERLETSGARYEVGYLNDVQCVCLVTGMGAENARKGASQILEDWAVDAFIVAGLSGALTKDLAIADLVLGEGLESRIGFGDRYFELDSIASLPEITRGKLISVDKIVETSEEKAELYQQTAAIAVDMESAGCISVASQKRRLRCFVLRSISDTNCEVIPAEVARFMHSNGRPKIMTLLWYLLRRPTLFYDLQRLFTHSSKACHALAGGLVKLIQQLDQENDNKGVDEL